MGKKIKEEGKMKMENKVGKILILISQVKDRYPEKDIQDIKIDLQFTNNVQTTLNRIKCGQFLKDTVKDTSKAFIILDSDEEDEVKIKDNKAINIFD
ncbi:unnamed protein product [Cunninghamella blakesleeana]